MRRAESLAPGWVATFAVELLPSESALVRTADIPGKDLVDVGVTNNQKIVVTKVDLFLLGDTVVSLFEEWLVDRCRSWGIER